MICNLVGNESVFILVSFSVSFIYIMELGNANQNMSGYNQRSSLFICVSVILYLDKYELKINTFIYS